MLMVYNGAFIEHFEMVLLTVFHDLLLINYSKFYNED